MAPTTVSQYIASVPPQARKTLREIRGAIAKAVPGITERISYRIARFDLDGKYLLYMAGFESHASIYPVTSGMVAKHGKEIKSYRSGAGTLRFALDKRPPLGLIAKLAKVRAQERRAAATSGKTRGRSRGKR